MRVVLSRAGRRNVTASTRTESRTHRLLVASVCLASALSFATQWPVATARADVGDGLPAADTTPSTSLPLPSASSASTLTPPPDSTAPASPSNAPPPAPPQVREGWTPFEHWTSDDSGTVHAEFSLGPAYRHDDQGWHPIDPTVVTTSDPLHPFAAPNAVVPIRFGTTPASLVTLDLPGGPIVMSSTLLDAQAPLALGNGVSFTGVAQDTDLRYSVSNQGVREEIVLRTRQAPTHFVFHISDPQHQLGTPHGDGQGGYAFDGDIGSSMTVVMPGASAATEGAPGPESNPQQVLTPTLDGFDVTIDVDPTWFASASLPVVIDPSLYVGGDSSHSSGLREYSLSSNTDCAQGRGKCPIYEGDDLYMRAGRGTWNGYDLWYRSLMRFDLSTIPFGSSVSSARVDMWQVDCLPIGSLCANEVPGYAAIHRYTAPFPVVGTSITFNDAALHIDAGEYASVAYQGTCGYSNPPPCDEAFIGTSFTGLVGQWVNGLDNNGIVLESQYEATQNSGGYDWFSTYYPGADGKFPKLSVDYTPPPGAPTSVTATAQDQAATVTWQAPVDNQGPPVTSYTAQVFNADGSAAASPYTCNCSQYQATGLVNGKTYFFRVYATNSVGNGPSAQSNSVTLPPFVVKSVSPTGVAMPGSTVTYTVTITNKQAAPLSVDQLVDTFTPGMSVRTGDVLVDGATYCVSNPSSCTVSGEKLTITGLSQLQNLNQQHVISYPARVVTGTGICDVVNTAQAVNGNGTATTTVPISVCDSGLGMESWWSYVNRTTGPQSTAWINVANGNLVLQQTDLAPVQAHGHLAYLVRRTYNSEDSGLAPAFGLSLGSGWVFNIAGMDDAASGEMGASGLYLPSDATVAQPVGVVLVDRDGTRHWFAARTLPVVNVSGTGTTPLDVLRPRVLAAEVGFTNICVDQVYDAPAGVHLALWRYVEVTSAPLSGQPCTPLTGTTPKVLGFGAERPDRLRYEFSADGHLLDMLDAAGVDLRYAYTNAPTPGADLSKLKYVYEVLSGCTPDGNGNLPATCRKLSFAYDATTPLHWMAVTDPAGRVVQYNFTYVGATRYLTQVVNNCADPAKNVPPPCSATPVGSSGAMTMTYHGVGTGSCGGSVGELCSVTDPMGDSSNTASPYATQVTYGTVSTIGPKWVTALTDRRGNATTFTYSTTQGSRYTLADQGNHRQQFRSIDRRGRVGEVDEGDTSNNSLHVTLRTWDHDADSEFSTAQNCRQPDARVDNDLCQQVVRSLAAGSSSDATTVLQYNDEGYPLVQHKLDSPANETTTYGYAVQVVQGSGGTACFTDSVVGYNSAAQRGDVTSAQDTSTAGCTTTSTARTGGTALFSIDDGTQMLTPRGNLAPPLAGGHTYTDFRTTYTPDRKVGETPNPSLAPPGGISSPWPSTQTYCAPAASHNTGLLCQQTEPAYAGSSPRITRFGYDNFGQKVGMQSPLANSTGQGIFTYTYFADSDLDLSQSVSAGGWLRGVTDPTGHFVAFGYDRAGNLARSWDRNATDAVGQPLTVYPGDPSIAVGSSGGPPSCTFSETLHQSAAIGTACAGAASTRSAFASPWRYALSQRDPMGNLAVSSVTLNGDTTASETPRGTVGASSNAVGASYVTQRTYDHNDNLVSLITPVEGSPAPTTYQYDVFNNRTVQKDPRDMFTTFVYDSVNRLQARNWTHGAWPSLQSQVPAGCGHQTTSSDAPLPLNESECTATTGYDGEDNAITSSPGNGETTTATFDGDHHRLQTASTRTSGVIEHTGAAYDADGHQTDECTPRDYDSTEGRLALGSCPATALYGTHAAYDAAGAVMNSSIYRVAAGTADSAAATPLTTTYSRHPDGNVTATTNPLSVMVTDTYDVLDRRIREYVPRSAAQQPNVTVWTYDASGNATSVLQPGSLIAGSGQDGTLNLSGQQCPQSAPCTVATGKQFSSISLTGGAWITASASSNGTLVLQVSGTVSVCSTCGITMTGAGPAGGQGGQSPNGPGTPGDGNGGGQGGANAAVAGGGGGGGGHATTGGAGTGRTQTGVAAGGAGGATYGPSASGLTDSSGVSAMGSGGGGGGGNAVQAGADGGAGGGFLHITANYIDDAGTISADGDSGGTLTPGGQKLGGAGGGGGSGGTVWLTAQQLKLHDMHARGGAGSAGTDSTTGGSGGAGVVRLDADALDLYPGGSVDTTQITPVGRITDRSYDADNRPVDTVVGASAASAATAGTASGTDNTRTRVAYDPDGHIVARWEPRAFTSSTALLSQQPWNPAYQVLMTRTDFDADGRAVAQYVPRFDNTDLGGAYSDEGLSSTQNQQCAANAQGKTPQSVASVPNYLGAVAYCVTQVVYDLDGNRATVIMPTSNGADGRRISYSYFDDNTVSAITAPSAAGTGAITAHSFLRDGDGRVTQDTRRVTGSLSEVTSYQYSVDRLLLQVTAPPDTANGRSHVTSYQYDANGDQTTTTAPSGVPTETAFFSDGTRSDVTQGATSDPLAAHTVYTYDGAGNTLTVQSPSATANDAGFSGFPAGASKVVQYAYTADNLVSSVTEPVASAGPTYRVTSFRYDPAGRKTSSDSQKMVAPVGGSATYTDAGSQAFSYAPDDRQLSQVGRETSTPTHIDTTYDAAGNPTTISETDHSGSSSALTATFYLDGSLRTLGDGSRTSSYTYDGAGSVAAERQTGGAATQTTTYAYNDAELPSSLTWNPGAAAFTTSWTYDDGGRPATESDPGGQSLSFSFNTDDTLAQRQLTAAAGSLATWQYGWDAGYRMTSETLTLPAASRAQTFSYDTIGRVTHFDRSTLHDTYSWDHDGNRTQDTFTDGSNTITQAWAYRADNSIGTSTKTTNGVAAPQVSYTYNDGTGTLSNDGSYTYTFDGLDRLLNAQAASGPAATTYLYDGLDRVRRRSETTPSGSTTTTDEHFTGHTTALASEQTGSQQEVVYGNDPGGTQRYVSQAQTQVVFEDSRGDTSALTSTSAPSAVACAQTFDPFGIGTAVSGLSSCATASATPSTRQFHSARVDQVTGTYQFGARTYDPTKSGWLSRDTSRQAANPGLSDVGTDPLTANTYTYVNGDPLNLDDPTGHCGGCSMSPDAQHCAPWNIDPNGNATVMCGNTWSDDPYAKAAPDIHGLTADIYKTRDFLQTIGSLAKGCVTSWSGAAGCAAVAAAALGQEGAAAALFAASSVPAALDCLQHPDWDACVSAAAGLLPAGGLAAKAVLRHLVGANAADLAAGALEGGGAPGTPRAAVRGRIQSAEPPRGDPSLRSSATEGASTGPDNAFSANAAAALRSKLGALQDAQSSADSVRYLQDDRVRYYGFFVPARNLGATQGAAYVTEWNIVTNDVRAWMESYDWTGEVNRIHLKMLNGEQVFVDHFPPTASEMEP